MPAPPTYRPAHLADNNFLILDEVNAAVGASLDRHDPQAALSHIVAGVHHAYLLPAFSHRGLYIPQLDRRLEELAAGLATPDDDPDAVAEGPATLLIATELYDLGGHSRALLDVSREVPRPLVVLTDLFGSYARDPARLQAVRQRFSHAEVFVLPAGSHLDKCVLLQRFTRSVRPQNILYFAHHQDPVPYVGTLASGAARKILFHHADHNASLGCTLPGFLHVDFSETLRDVCARQLEQPVALLPMFVPDQGAKVFAPVKATQWSVVTSGHPAKFLRNGTPSLQDIVTTVLATIQGQFFHIGPLDEGWVAEIRRHLQAQGLDPQRFIHRGLVPSVWGELHQLDAVCYLGSAPVGGGRAAIEAQGCGYPLVYYRGQEEGSMLANFTLYANQELGWATFPELQEALRLVGQQHGKFSQRARSHYELTCSEAVFQQALKGILQV